MSTIIKQCPKCGHSVELTQYYVGQSTFSYDCVNCKGHVTIN